MDLISGKTECQRHGILMNQTTVPQNTYKAGQKYRRKIYIASLQQLGPTAQSVYWTNPVFWTVGVNRSYLEGERAFPQFGAQFKNE
jgi:hypothetical protein